MKTKLPPNDLIQDRLFTIFTSSDHSLNADGHVGVLGAQSVQFILHEVSKSLFGGLHPICLTVAVLCKRCLFPKAEFFTISPCK